jgi:hypothetical protein
MVADIVFPLDYCPVERGRMVRDKVTSVPVLLSFARAVEQYGGAS